MNKRLLPWSGDRGQPCYLHPDSADSGFVSRLADGLEAIQLGMAVDLLDYVEVALPDLSARELYGLVGPLHQALRDVSRVAGGRSERLGVSSQAIELVIAARRLATVDEPSPESSLTELRGLVTMLREALSGVVDLAETYGEQLPQPESDGAALWAAEVINREVSHRRGVGPDSMAALRNARVADGSPASMPDQGTTEGGA